MIANEISGLTTYAMDNFLSAIGVFLTIVTAYIIAAYIVGKKLTTLQLAIVNGSFLTSATIMGYLVSANFRVFYIYASSNPEGIVAMSPDRPPLVDFTVPLSILLVSIVLGCFVFMFSVRRSGPV